MISRKNYCQSKYLVFPHCVEEETHLVASENQNIVQNFLNFENQMALSKLITIYVAENKENLCEIFEETIFINMCLANCNVQRTNYDLEFTLVLTLDRFFLQKLQRKFCLPIRSNVFIFHKFYCCRCCSSRYSYVNLRG